MKKYLFFLLCLLNACSTIDEDKGEFNYYKYCADQGYEIGGTKFYQCLKEQQSSKIKQDFREKKADSRSTLSWDEFERLQAKEKEQDLTSPKAILY